jgi:hypothetical protein
MMVKSSKFAPKRIPPALPTTSKECHSRGLFPVKDLSNGEIWIAHEGVNPCGLFVRRGGV